MKRTAAYDTLSILRIDAEDIKDMSQNFIIKRVQVMLSVCVLMRRFDGFACQ